LVVNIASKFVWKTIVKIILEYVGIECDVIYGKQIINEDSEI
jgi:hypothetical protein